MARWVTRAGLATAFTNVVLAALYLLFLAAHLSGFVRSHRPSFLLMALTETLFVVFFVARRDPSAVSFSFTAWVSTVAGTLLPMLARPVLGAQEVLVGQVVQAAGSAFSIYGIASLNRSLGLLPANRGVRTSGAYRWVRHPLYASYTLAHFGYLASNPSVRNTAIFVVALAAQVVRIQQEEQLLRSDPAYVAYAARARWRLLPFVY